MSNVSISNLPSVTSAQASSQVPAVQNGTTVYVTVDQIAKYTQTTYPITGITSITAQSPLSGGTITSSGTIGLNTGAITNSYLSNMPALTIKGNNANGSSVPADLTVAQTMTLLGAAPLASPAFTGTPTAPTPASSDSSTTLATTAYVKAQGYGVGTVNSITAGTGLSGGTITLSGTIAIANTGVSPATYGSASNSATLTVNAQGQITAASNTPILISPSQVTGLGSMATQNANAVAITGGTINGTTIGGTTPAAATFTALTATGNASFTTITSGTWNGTAIAITYGGTGATTASGARTALGAAASGANSDITSLTGLTTPLQETEGGTGYGSYTTGDILYASSSSTLARLNDVATGNVLLSGGVGVAPSYGKVGLTTHVTGTLPTTNGGTGLTSFTSGGAVYATSSSVLATGTLPVTAGGTGAATLTGYLVGNGTSAITAVSTIPNAGLTNSSVTIGSTSISLGSTATTISGLTTLTLTQDPTTALQASTKQYVDNQVATVSNQTFHTASAYATTADLGTVTYNNGTSGVGATITNAGTQAALAIDGYTFTATDVTNATRVLVKNQSSGLQNGIYVVTNQGSVSTNWVLTRATDFNTVGTGPNFIETGAATFVTGGTANGSTSWVMNTTGTITVGSTALVWAQTSSAGNIQVTSPITKTGNTIGLSTVGISLGGTGQTTASAAFNALSPITSTGDLIIGNGTNSATRLAIGTSGYVLTSNGTTATWAASTGGVTSFQTSLSGLTPSSGATGAVTLAGTLGVTSGGTGTTTTFTTGSVVFAGASGVYSQNNAKFFWDNTNNRLGINTASPQTQLTVVSNTQTTTPSGALPAGTDIYIVGANSANTRITQDAYGTGSYGVFTARSARGTAASPTASQSGDFLAQFTARGYGATGFGTASTGYFALTAAENFTDTAQGTSASIYITATGTNAVNEGFRVGPAGQIGVGAGAISYGTSNYVLTSGGTSASPSWSLVSLTSSVTGTLSATNGGTGLSSYTTGDLLYASSSTALSRLADVATGNVLLSGGVGVAPSWGQVSLTTAVTGVLPSANGGTGINNGTNTITLGGNVTHSGAFTQTFIATGNTSVTLPTSGTLVNTAVTTLSSLSSIGTVTVGTWNASVISVAYGGTGASSLTANNVLLGNGTSALQVVAPGTSGNVLTSNGTTWVSSTPAASGPSKAQAIAYSMILGY